MEHIEVEPGSSLFTIDQRRSEVIVCGRLIPLPVLYDMLAAEPNRASFSETTALADRILSG